MEMEISFDNLIASCEQTRQETTHSQYRGNPPYPLARVKLTPKARDNNLFPEKTHVDQYTARDSQ